MLQFRSLLLLCLVFSLSGQKCKILALEGGGDRGSFQAGVLSKVFNTITTADYDVISGVSVGSIGAMALAQYPKGQEQNAASWMIQMWRDIRRSDVYKNWPGGPFASLLNKPSIFDTTVMKEFFQKYFLKVPQRKVSVGTTNANTGEFVRFNEKMFTTIDDFISEVLCSSAMPGLFIYQNFYGSTFVDGGTLINLDIAGGVLRCLEDGFQEEDIIIDVVLANAAVNIKEVPDHINVQHMYNKIEEIKNFQGTFRDVRAAYVSYPRAQFRYLFLPLSPLPYSIEPIYFIPSQIEHMINQGQADAEEILKWGEGVSFTKYLNQV